MHSTQTDSTTSPPFLLLVSAGLGIAAVIALLLDSIAGAPFAISVAGSALAAFASLRSAAAGWALLGVSLVALVIGLTG